jgi:hypothetical protein
LNDVETFEVDPHGMSGIGELTVSESVGCQQVTELIVICGLGNAEDWYKCESKPDHAETDEQHAEALVPCQAHTSVFDPKENGWHIGAGCTARGK